LTQLQTLQVRAFNTAQEHGFTDASLGERIALIHSEVSEALEAYRVTGTTGVWYEEGTAKPEGVPFELADAVIRILDLCENEGINLERAIEEKMDYNDTRPFRHGGKHL
jgi:NTP pyrophosphatase (non-canonical NTP hydrolase)